MALEPVLAAADAGPNRELVDMTRRFWIGLALSLPVVVLEMGGHFFGITHAIGQHTSNVIQLLLATPVVLWAGWPFFVRGWQSLVTRNLHMFTFFGITHAIGQHTSNVIQLLLAPPGVLCAGWPFFVRGWQWLVTLNLNMLTLIAMCTWVASLYSVVATLAPAQCGSAHACTAFT